MRDFQNSNNVVLLSGAGKYVREEDRIDFFDWSPENTKLMDIWRTDLAIMFGAERWMWIESNPYLADGLTCPEDFKLSDELWKDYEESELLASYGFYRDEDGIIRETDAESEDMFVILI